MKKLLCVLSLLLSANAMAESSVTIECAKDAYRVRISGLSADAQPGAIANYELQKDGQAVGSGTLALVNSGYESSFLRAYLWGLQSADGNSILGLGVPGLKTPVPGSYEGKADLLVSAGGHTMDGSTVSCQVTIQ